MSRPDVRNDRKPESATSEKFPAGISVQERKTALESTLAAPVSRQANKPSVQKQEKPKNDPPRQDKKHEPVTGGSGRDPKRNPQTFSTVQRSQTHEGESGINKVKRASVPEANLLSERSATPNALEIEKMRACPEVNANSTTNDTKNKTVHLKPLPTKSENGPQNATAAPVNLSANVRGKEQEKKKMTILFLGESGAGKSTCVNAIANYIKFANMNEALKGELTYVIPCKFFLMDSDYKQFHVQISQSSNENFEHGKSATQKSRTYSFETKKYSVSIIDTPGINDTEGHDQDQRNIDEIFLTLSAEDLKTLNVIAFFIKSNVPRLTKNVSYCINELMRRLHPNAATNFCFILTHSRGTFYRPGNTMDTLRQFLEDMKKGHGIEIPLEKNVFCVDNEAFRLVCAKHRGCSFFDAEKEKFETSWVHSVKEIYKFLDYAAELQPHVLSETIELNSVIRKIQLMAWPLANAVQQTVNDITLTVKAQKGLAAGRGPEANQNYIKCTKLRFVSLDSFRVVCTSEKCAPPPKDGSHRQPRNKKICLDPCYLSTCANDESAIKTCTIMNRDGKCKICSCSWKEHTRICAEKTRSISLMGRPMTLQELEERIQWLKDEGKALMNFCILCYRFLKEHTMIRFEDAFRYELLQIIDEERRIRDTNFDLKSLNEWLKKYEKCRVSQADVPSDSETFCREQKKVFQLKYCGLTIENSYKCQKIATEKERKHAIRKLDGATVEKKSVNDKKAKSNSWNDGSQREADSSQIQPNVNSAPTLYL